MFLTLSSYSSFSLPPMRVAVVHDGEGTLYDTNYDTGSFKRAGAMVRHYFRNEVISNLS